MKRYVVEDLARNQNSLSAPLLSSQPLSHLINCLKMLHGRAKIKCNSSGKIIRLSFNYAKLSRARDGISSRGFVKEILGPDISISEGESLFANMRSMNVSFFKNLEKEIIQCLACLKQDMSIEAFLHFYRTVEKISISFPLIYISAQNDFEKSLTFLRPYFQGDGGELSFVNKFSSFIAKEISGTEEYRVDFFTKLDSIEKFNILCAEINRCCPGFLGENVDSESGRFSISFEDCPRFIVECRNRLFHFSNSGQRNFDVDRIDGSSELCRMLCEGGLHWLAVALDEVIRRQSARIRFA